MTDCDVVVIGAGAAGLSAGALLATEGKRVLVTDRSPVLGGRAMAVPDEGFTVNAGGHLIEDPGSGLTKVFEHVGKELVHGTVSAEMPVWDNDKQAWGPVRDRYAGSKSELKKVIKALVETPYSELDRWDDKSLRQWLRQYTDDQGVIDLFEFITVLECMTDQWWDHSASDNLYVRKMHFSERGTAAYSCWPGQGWDGMLYPAGGRPRQGRDAIVAYYPRLLAGWAEHVDQPGRRITAANTVVVEIAFTGTTREGRSVAFDAVDIFDLAGPRIRRLSIWYDTAAVLRQVQGA